MTGKFLEPDGGDKMSTACTFVKNLTLIDKIDITNEASINLSKIVLQCNAEKYIKAVMRYSFVVAYASVSKSRALLDTFNELLDNVLSEEYFIAVLDVLRSLQVSQIAKVIILDSLEFMINGGNDFWRYRHRNNAVSIKSHLNLILLNQVLKFKWQDTTTRARVFDIQFWFNRTQEIAIPTEAKALGGLADVVCTIHRVVITLRGARVDVLELLTGMVNMICNVSKTEILKSGNTWNSTRANSILVSSTAAAEDLSEFFKSLPFKDLSENLKSEELEILSSVVCTRLVEQCEKLPELALTVAKLGTNIDLLVLRDSLVSALTERLLTTNMNKWRALQQVHRYLSDLDMQSQLGLQDILLDAIFRHISATSDEQALDGISIDFLLDLPIPRQASQSSSPTRAMLLHYLSSRGSLLFSEVNKGLVNRSSLDRCNVLLDRYFGGDCTSVVGDAQAEGFARCFLEPIENIISGILRRAMSERARGIRGDNTARGIVRSVIEASTEVLALVLSATAYTGAVDGEGNILRHISDGFASFLHESSIDALLQMDLEVFFGHFDVMKICFEAEKSHKPLPDLYTRLSNTLGEILFMAQTRHLLGQDEVMVSNSLFALCARCLPTNSDIYFCSVAMEFVRLSVNFGRDVISRNPYKLPSSLTTFKKAIDSIMTSDRRVNITEQCKQSLLELCISLAERIQESKYLFESKEISKNDVQILCDERALRNLVNCAKEFNISFHFVGSALDNLLESFDKFIHETKSLKGVIQFLEYRELLPGNHGSRLPTEAELSTLTFTDIADRIGEVKAVLRLDPNVLLALMKFSRDSEIFAARFDEALRMINAQNGINTLNSRDKTDKATKTALAGLRNLVSSDQVRINDFSVDLPSMLQELQGQGRRRQGKLEKELELAASYFREVAGNEVPVAVGRLGHVRNGEGTLEASLQRLTAAFALVRYRDGMGAFKTALRELGQTDLLQIVTSSVPIAEIEGNFLVSRSIELLNALMEVFCGLDHWHLNIIGQMASENEVVVGQILIFFRKHGDNFDGAMERAHNRAVGNTHATRVLRKLEPLREFLKPFWHAGHRITSFGDLTRHMRQHVRMNGEDICVTFEELGNVIENWAEVEIYFRDGRMADGGADDIVRIVKLYLQTGQFMSSLTGHPGGESLSFTYGTIEKKSLSCELLEEHTQWEMLGGNSSSDDSSMSVEDLRLLEEFVAAKVLATEAHLRRLALQRAGHPNFQTSTCPPTAIADTCEPEDVRESLLQLSNELTNWEWEMKNACDECTRLRLLSHKSRVHFLLALKARPASSAIADILPYVMHCFHLPQENEDDIMSSLRDCLHEMDGFDSNDLDACLILRQAVHLLGALEFKLGVAVTPGFGGKVSRLDLHGRSSSDIYCSHVSDMVSCENFCGYPSSTLWGELNVTKREIDDFLSVASVGICNTMHVMNVNKLSPRMRGELMTGLQAIESRSPIILMFGDQSGSEGFWQYGEEDAPVLHNDRRVHSDLFWCQYKKNPADDAPRCAVWMVCGHSGSGKTRFICDKAKSLGVTAIHRFVVHEGFSAQLVINKLFALWECQTNDDDDNATERSICLHFDVTEYVNMGVFQRFLHYFLALGLLIDEDSGKCGFIKPGIKVKVFVEMPCIKQYLNGPEQQEPTLWPPGESKNWHASHHPLNTELPVLSVVIPPENYVSIYEDSPFIQDEKSVFVARYVLAAEVQGPMFGLHEQLPTPFDNDVNIINDDDDTALIRFFSAHFDGSSKRVLSQAIELMYERCLYIGRIQQETWSDSQGSDEYVSMTRFMEPGAIAGIFTALVKEVQDITSESGRMADTAVFSIRPQWRPEAADCPVTFNFDLVVATCDIHSSLYLNMKSCYEHAMTLNMEAGDIDDSVRSRIAPAFGMRNTGKMFTTLKDCGHLFTPDSLLRIMHMHNRRAIGTSVIYEGQTGCGKSQNMQLYSLLINCDASLFTNLKVHMLAILKVLVTEVTATIASTAGTEDEEEDQIIDNETLAIAATNVNNLLSDCSADAMLRAFIHWLRLCPDYVINIAGAAICTYFRKLLEMYPLYTMNTNGAALGVHRVMAAFEEWSTGNPAIADQLKYYSDSAGNSLFLAGEGMSVLYSHVGEYKECSIDKHSELPALFENEDALQDCLHQLLSLTPALLYDRLLADEGLVASKWREYMNKIRGNAEQLKILAPGAVLCVFVDELNTAGCIGMLSEAFLSHSVDGNPLPDNIFFCGAINPYRPSSATLATIAMQTNSTKSNVGERREEDENEDYLAGVTYVVKPLPPSMDRFKMWYPNLTLAAEKCFVRDYVKMHLALPPPPNGVISETWEVDYLLKHEYTDMVVNVIVSAQQIVRSYHDHIPRVFMSIRNLIRAVHMLSWLLQFDVATEIDPHDASPKALTNIFLPPEHHHARSASAFDKSLVNTQQRMRNALVMAVSTIYMLQLPSSGYVAAKRAKADLRQRFLDSITATWRECLWDTCASESVMIVEQWNGIITSSWKHLWRYATIPRGIAATNTLMENFYTIILASMNGMPVLITGPPGCGKTLSFMLACNNLGGSCLQHTVAFQRLKKAKKFMYQCSTSSTGPDIAARFQDALSHQRDLNDRQPGRHLCIVGFDEAGLVPENRQALKSMHDFLDMREIGVIMMSNTTLDAAKVSRTIQILATQANMEDLQDLANGLLIENVRVSEDIRTRWETSIGGLCAAFLSVGDVLPPSNNWFHSRDFVYLCRLIRKQISTSDTPLQTLFSAEMLMYALRRHFQTVDPHHFPLVALHFLDACGFSEPPRDPVDNVSDDNLSSRTIESLRDSLHDGLEATADPTFAHCRYSLLIDPTDSEVSIDLLFALRLLDQDTCNIVTMSDFPDDATSARRTAVLAQIKRSIECGDTVVLINSSSTLQAALYDVINRLYVISVNADGSRDAFANISLGSFSRYVKIHPKFRLVIHLPKSKLAVTELPFLNRLEKYTLSVSNVLAQKIQDMSINLPPLSLRSLPTANLRERLLREMEKGVDHFISFCGGSSSFYGMSPSETAPALVLRALEDAYSGKTIDFLPRQSLLAKCKLANASKKKRTSRRDKRYPVEDGIESKSEAPGENDLDGDDDNNDESDFEDDISEDDDMNYTANAPATTDLRRIIRLLNFQALETARVESIFQLRESLPAVYTREYIDMQEHFSVVAFVRMLINAPPEVQPDDTEKIVVYTRTDETILRLGSDRDPHFASELFAISTPDADGIHQGVSVVSANNASEAPSHCPLLSIIQLSTIKSSAECEMIVRATMNAASCPRIWLLVADMKLCTASQLNFVRHAVDLDMTRLIREQTHMESDFTALPRIIFLLHVPPEQLNMRPCYQTIPINNWTAVYVDSFIDALVDDSTQSGTSNVDAGVTNATPQWLRVAFSLASAPSIADVHREFRNLAKEALIGAVMSINYRQSQPSNITLSTEDYFFEKGVGISQPAYARGNKDWVKELLQNKECIFETLIESFVEVWKDLLASTVKSACDRITKGLTSRGLVECVRSTHKWLLEDFMRTLVKRDLAANWNLEALCDLPSNSIPLDLALDDVSRYVTTQRDSSAGLALICAHMIRDAVVTNGTVVSQSKYMNVSVECKAPKASHIPMYDSLITRLASAVPYALSISRSQSRGGFQSAQLNDDDVALRSLWFKKSKFENIAVVVEVIEKRKEIWNYWCTDFVAINLQYHNHTTCEVELLTCIAVEFVQHGVGVDHERCGSVSRWILLQSKLQTHLHAPSSFLIAIRPIVTQEDIAAVIDSIKNNSPLDAEETSDSRCIRLLTGLAVTRVWDVLMKMVATEQANHSLQEGTAIIDYTKTYHSWIQCVRNICALPNFSVDALLSDSSTSETEGLAEEFLLIAFIFKIASLTTCGQRDIMNLLHKVSDHFQSHDFVGMILRITLEVSRDHQIQELVVNLLSWLCCMERRIYEGSFALLVAGVIGIRNKNSFQLEYFNETETASILHDVFGCLPLSARYELLKKLLETNAHMVEDILESLLEESMDPLLRIANAQYVPVVVKVAVTEYAIVQVLDGHAEVDDPEISYGENDFASTVIFRTLLFLQSSEHGAFNIEDCISSILEMEVYGIARSNMWHLRHAVKVLQIVNLFVAGINGIDAEETTVDINLIRAVGGHRSVETIARLIRPSLRVWVMYMLSRIRMTVLPLVLADRELLLELGLNWLQIPQAIANDALLSEAEIAEHQKRLKLSHSILIAAHYASASVLYTEQQFQFKPPSMLDILRVDNNTLPLEQQSATFVKMMLHESRSDKLAANVHIRAVVAMAEFARDKLAFRLKSAEDFLVPLEDEIDKLPLEERWEGSNLLKEFLKAWESLRDVFMVFGQCGREAAAAAPIPRLTDRYGENPVLLSHVVEVGGTTVVESCPARMLESNLFQQITDVLSDPTVVRLRADETFNCMESLASLESDTVNMSVLSNPASRDIILMGANGSKKSRSILESVLYSNLEWHQDTPAPRFPADAVISGPTIQFEDALNQIKEREARENQIYAHNNQYVVCPDCGSVSQRIDGCHVLSCGRPTDPHAHSQPITVGTGVLGQLGCGRELDFNVHRVPLPGPDPQSIHPLFKPSTARIPAHLLRIQPPALPDIPSSRGHYVVNWTAIARHLMASTIHGKVKFKIDGYFRPLSVATAENADMDWKDRQLFSERGAGTDSSSRRYNWSDIGDGVASVYVRLRVMGYYLKDAVQKKLSGEANLALGKSEASRLHAAFSRLPEVRLEDMSSKLFCLCMHALNLLSSDAFNQSCFQSIDLVDVALARVFETSTPSDGDSWPLWLIEKLAAMPLIKLGTIAEIVSNIGIDGNWCAHPTLAADFSHEESVRLEGIQEEFVDMLTAGTEMSVYMSELSDLGSLLMNNVDALLTGKDTMRFCDLSIFASCMSDPNKAISRRILAHLQARHYGALLRFIRQTIGLLSFTKIVLSTSHEDTRNETAEGDGMSIVPNIDQARIVYSELVPTDWEELQRVESRRKELLTKPAVQVLLEERDHDGSESGDEFISPSPNVMRDWINMNIGVEEVDSDTPSANAPSTMTVAMLYQAQQLLSSGLPLVPSLERGPSSSISDDGHHVGIPTSVFREIGTVMGSRVSDEFENDDVSEDDGIETKSGYDRDGSSERVDRGSLDENCELTDVIINMVIADSDVANSVAELPIATIPACDTTPPYERDQPAVLEVAWDIITTSKCNSEEIKNILDNVLEATESADLSLEIVPKEYHLQLAELLCPCQKWKYLSLFGIATPTLPALHADEAALEQMWTILSKNATVKMQLEELGVLHNGDLRYVDNFSLDEMASKLLVVPAGKLRKIMKDLDLSGSK